MKKHLLTKMTLLLCALIASSSYGWAQASLPFSYTSNGKPSSVTGFTDSGFETYSAKTGAKFDSNGDYAQLYFNGIISTVP